MAFRTPHAQSAFPNCASVLVRFRLARIAFRKLTAQVAILEIDGSLLEPFPLQWITALETPRMTEEMRCIPATERP